jgi:hypothetical protein
MKKSRSRVDWLPFILPHTAAEMTCLNRALHISVGVQISQRFRFRNIRVSQLIQTSQVVVSSALVHQTYAVAIEMLTVSTPQDPRLSMNSDFSSGGTISFSTS